MPRNPELPEGTDHIITGAMETGAGADASTGSSGAAGAPGGDTGFVASGSAGGLGDGTGGTSVGGSGTGGLSTSGGGSGSGLSSGSGSSSGGSSSGGGAAEKLAGQVREQVYGLKEQATDKARQLADTGKGQVTSTLNNLTEIVNEAARAVDERFGEQYGQYAHRAADAVSSLATTIDGKSLEDLVDDTRSAVRKSPAIAVGTAALLGFVLMRVVKAGLPVGDGESSDRSSTANRGGTGSTGGQGSTANRTNA
jgi:ElaB/YqjD/DUF883 family membrane-anchored ribosome-binding protein